MIVLESNSPGVSPGVLSFRTQLIHCFLESLIDVLSVEWVNPMPLFIEVISSCFSHNIVSITVCSLTVCFDDPEVIYSH